MMIIRADGNPEIGSGHIMRCSAIAAEAVADGCGVLFAVSDETSRALVESRGYRCRVVGGDYRKLGVDDADKLATLAKGHNAVPVLVDSYAAGDAFFSRLAACGMACVYIDDAYTFEGGFSAAPVWRDVAGVVNHGFGFELMDYEAVYRGAPTALHVGLEYAPVREGFRGVAYAVRPEIGSVLVTSGMTNPDGVLERMAAGCRAALPDVHIAVIVGASADFDETCLFGTDYEAVHDARNMPELMASADLAVSAAGTTLYELACTGVPVIAAPIVENQIGNARGIRKLGLGESLDELDWDAGDVQSAVSKIAASRGARLKMSSRGRKLLDGWGARRIYQAVKSSCRDGG